MGHNTDSMRGVLLELAGLPPDYPSGVKLELFSGPAGHFQLIHQWGQPVRETTWEAVQAAFGALFAPVHTNAPPESTPATRVLVHKDAAGTGRLSMVPAVLIDAASLAELLSVVDSLASVELGMELHDASATLYTMAGRARSTLNRSALVESGGLEALWRQAAGQGDASSS